MTLYRVAVLVALGLAGPALAQADQAEPPKPQTLLLVEMAPLDGVFVAEKDAGLKRALGALPARLRAWREAVPEMLREVPAEAIGLLENVMTRTKRLAVTNRGFDPDTGMPGMGVAFTLDGPRGPAKVAQPGAVFLARITGNPIVPFHIEAGRAWTARSWDRTQVPKPGAVIGVAIGEPFHVPPDIDDDALEAHRLELETRLAALERRAIDLSHS